MGRGKGKKQTSKGREEKGQIEPLCGKTSEGRYKKKTKNHPRVIPRHEVETGKGEGYIKRSSIKTNNREESKGHEGPTPAINLRNNFSAEVGGIQSLPYGNRGKSVRGRGETSDWELTA